MDGCRAGWVVVTTAAAGPAPVDSVRVVARIAEVVDDLRRGRLSAVAVDMPLGLPRQGPRSSDALLRRRLGPRRSSVFPTPPRGVLGAGDHAEAVARSRRIEGRGISVQAFNLLGRIAELDEATDPSLADRLVEAHPESAFAELAGAPLDHTKRTATGRRQRLELLAEPFPVSGELLSAPLRGARPDDVLDAAAVAWTARRWLAGEALVIGDDGPDERGIPMRVVV